MNPSRRQGLAALCACGAALSGLSLGFGTLRPSVLTGALVAWALALPSYGSLAWALRRTDRIFYGVFAAGIFLRLAGLAATAYVVYRKPGLNLAATLLALVGALFLLSFVEIYFLHRESRDKDVS